ncbi:hypothetical protein H4219_004240 [Mycoemilia scoparia]|uniref:Uncharacterized protein n=1 Tax=Mycoemilia scoparia TaxID=417184 RepID=A0A9W7ZT57_9FUNG|nr:hypothetical protein H4219_004240 [Mycoemilia scoparia]
MKVFTTSAITAGLLVCGLTSLSLGADAQSNNTTATSNNNGGLNIPGPADVGANNDQDKVMLNVTMTNLVSRIKVGDRCRRDDEICDPNSYGRYLECDDGIWKSRNCPVNRRCVQKPPHGLSLGGQESSDGGNSTASAGPSPSDGPRNGKRDDHDDDDDNDNDDSDDRDDDNKWEKECQNGIECLDDDERCDEHDPKKFWKCIKGNWMAFTCRRNLVCRYEDREAEDGGGLDYNDIRCALTNNDRSIATRPASADKLNAGGSASATDGGSNSNGSDGNSANAVSNSGGGDNGGAASSIDMAAVGSTALAMAVLASMFA